MTPQSQLETAREHFGQAVALNAAAQAAVAAGETDEHLSAEDYDARNRVARETARQVRITEAKLSEAQAAVDAAARHQAENELQALEAECTRPKALGRHSEALRAFHAALEGVRPAAQAIHALFAADEQRVARARELSVAAGRPTTATALPIAQVRALALTVAGALPPVDVSWAAHIANPDARATAILQAFGVGQARSVSPIEHARLVLESGDATIVLGPEAQRSAAAIHAFQVAEREAARVANAEREAARKDSFGVPFGQSYDH